MWILVCNGEAVIKAFGRKVRSWLIIFMTHVKKLKKKHTFTQVANSPFINSPQPPPPDSRSSTPTQIGDESRLKTSVSRNMDEGQVAQRSRWQAVLLEAGGLSAALSEESMQRLKYCLHWLQVRSSFFFYSVKIITKKFLFFSF